MRVVEGELVRIKDNATVLVTGVIFEVEDAYVIDDIILSKEEYKLIPLV
jgi:hypothetical protein